jgi:hypothetical protein
VFGTLKPPQGLADACTRVTAWTRERFRLEPAHTVLVTELVCGLPGCPPLETVIAFWTAADRRHHLKVFKPVSEVTPDDLPPWWMREALIVDPDADLACC